MDRGEARGGGRINDAWIQRLGQALVSERVVGERGIERDRALVLCEGVQTAADQIDIEAAKRLEDAPIFVGPADCGLPEP
jgi:hypothetical protein